MEKYSVLMSVYNKEKPSYLRESIDSMVSQTEKPDEIIIVKDGPLGKELDDVIKEYKDKRPELFVILELPENKGLGNALNKGLEISKNELVARMDTDDISLPDRCKKQLMEFEKNKNLCIVGTQINEFIDQPTEIIRSRVVPLTYDDILEFSKRRSPFNHPTVMYKKSKVLELGGYRTYGRKEDLDLFIRMIHENSYAINLNEVLLLYRSNQDNLQRRRSWVNCSEYISIMYSFYKKGYSRITDILYVVVGQLAMYIMPRCIISKLSNKYLRKKAIL